MAEYMENKADEQIEAGIHHRDEIYQEIESCEAKLEKLQTRQNNLKIEVLALKQKLNIHKLKNKGVYKVNKTSICNTRPKKKCPQCGFNMFFICGNGFKKDAFGCLRPGDSFNHCDYYEELNSNTMIEEDKGGNDMTDYSKAKNIMLKEQSCDL